MKAIRDRLINVPLTDEDINKTIMSLPRTEDKAGVVAVKLKRKLGMKNCHAEQFIDPNKCIRAVKKFHDLGNPHFLAIEIDEKFLEPKQGADDDAESMDMSSDSDESGDMLNSVKAHQGIRGEITCLVHENLEEAVVENLTKQVLSKKKKITSTKSFEIAPGEGRIPNNLMREEH